MAVFSKRRGPGPRPASARPAALGTEPKRAAAERIGNAAATGLNPVISHHDDPARHYGRTPAPPGPAFPFPPPSLPPSPPAPFASLVRLLLPADERYAGRIAPPACRGGLGFMQQCLPKPESCQDTDSDSLDPGHWPAVIGSLQAAPVGLHAHFKFDPPPLRSSMFKSGGAGGLPRRAVPLRLRAVGTRSRPAPPARPGPRRVPALVQKCQAGPGRPVRRCGRAGGAAAASHAGMFRGA